MVYLYGIYFVEREMRKLKRKKFEKERRNGLPVSTVEREISKLKRTQLEKDR